MIHCCFATIVNTVSASTCPAKYMCPLLPNGYEGTLFFSKNTFVTRKYLRRNDLQRSVTVVTDALKNLSSLNSLLRKHLSYTMTDMTVFFYISRKKNNT